MSTRGEIGFLMSDGTVYSIYNHCDSYLDGLGVDLIDGLRPSDDVLKFVFDRLTEYPESVSKYDNVDAYASSMECSDREYLYLWDGIEWKVVTCHFKTSIGDEYNHTFLPFHCEKSIGGSTNAVIVEPNGEVVYSD